MSAYHPSLAAGRWQKLSLMEQLGNVGSEVGRAARWQNKDSRFRDEAVFRALELLDLTLADPRWRGRLREIGRLREVLCDAWLGGNSYNTTLSDLDRYFLHFAVAARKR